METKEFFRGQTSKRIGGDFIDRINGFITCLRAGINGISVVQGTKIIDPPDLLDQLKVNIFNSGRECFCQVIEVSAIRFGICWIKLRTVPVNCKGFTVTAGERT